MKIFSSLLLLTGMSVVSLNCKKESKAAVKTNTDHITSAAWVHESSGVDFNKDGNIDFALSTLGVPACRLDNVLTFKKDNTAVSDEGATKCDPVDPQTTNFNWGFADNETNLNISGNVFSSLNGKLKIRTLTSTNFSLGKDTTLPLGNVTIIVNLKH